MPETNSDNPSPPENDPWLEKTKEKELRNQPFASSPSNISGPSVEDETLKKAMIEWKEKGNELLAQACAEALVEHNKSYEKAIPDDKRTQELKDKINLIEANQEAALRHNNTILDKSYDSYTANSLSEAESSDSPRNEIINSHQKTNYARQNYSSGIENTFLKKFQLFVDTKTILQLLALITSFELGRMLYFLFKLF